MIDLDLFSDISRDVAMTTDFVKKWQTPHFRCSGIQKQMGYRYLIVRVNSANDACIWCEKFVKFGTVTPELTGLICERLV